MHKITSLSSFARPGKKNLKTNEQRGTSKVVMKTVGAFGVKGKEDTDRQL